MRAFALLLVVALPAVSFADDAPVNPKLVPISATIGPAHTGALSPTGCVERDAPLPIYARWSTWVAASVVTTVIVSAVAGAVAANASSTPVVTKSSFTCGGRCDGYINAAR